MTRVVIGMEANQVAMQQTSQKFSSNGQDSVDFTTGKWCVKEKSNPNILLSQETKLLLKQFRKKHEMIIMHPDQVALLGFLSDGLGE